MEAKRAKEVRRYKRRQLAGLCTRCGKLPLYSIALCEPCLVHIKQKSIDNRKAYAEQGRCPRCGRSLEITHELDSSIKTCLICLEANKENKLWN